MSFKMCSVLLPLFTDVFYTMILRFYKNKKFKKETNRITLSIFEGT